jgi:hypothetical protein
MMRLALSATLCVAFGGAGEAHEAWADGEAIPAWIKSACCGPSDAHHLRPEQVHRISEELYEVDGYFRPIPVSEALPSADGE